ncbi:MAG: transposase [Culicoidibacterales bacterium]
MAIRKVMSGSKSDSKGRNTQVESYFFDIEKCKTCPFKDGCYKDGAKSKSFSVKIKQAIHIEYMETERFQELYDKRYKIEAKNGELKTRYGYSTAQGCGLLGMTIQAASTIFLANMKRIIKLKEQKSESI